MNFEPPSSSGNGDPSPDEGEIAKINRSAALHERRLQFESQLRVLHVYHVLWTAVAEAMEVDRGTLGRWREGKGVGDYSKPLAAAKEPHKQAAKKLVAKQLPGPVVIHTTEHEHPTVQNLQRLIAIGNLLNTENSALAVVQYQTIVDHIDQIKDLFSIGLHPKLLACKASAFAEMGRRREAIEAYVEAVNVLRGLVGREEDIYRYQTLSTAFIESTRFWIAHRRHNTMMSKHQMLAGITRYYRLVTEKPTVRMSPTTVIQRYSILLQLSCRLDDQRLFNQWVKEAMNDVSFAGGDDLAKKAQIREVVNEEANLDGSFDQALKNKWLRVLNSY